MNAFMILQTEVAQDAAQQAIEGAEALKMPFFEVAQKGGWLMLPIVLLSMLDNTFRDSSSFLSTRSLSKKSVSNWRALFD